MDYEKIYQDFIADRRGREALVGKGDRHHILPRSLGGDNSKENLVLLSYGDHLFAHILLAKVHGGMMSNTANRMMGMKKYRGRATRRHYQKIRRQASETMRLYNQGQTLTEEQRANFLASLRTPEARARFSKFHKERIAALRASGGEHAPSKGMKLSKERRQQISASSRVSATKQWKDEGVRRAITEKNLETWKDPKLKARHSEIMREVNKRPDVVAANIERTKASWADPIKRNQRIEKMKAAAARRPKKEKPPKGKPGQYVRSPQQIEAIRKIGKMKLGGCKFGYKQSPEHVEKCRRARIGTRHTLETKEKMRASALVREAAKRNQKLKENEV